MKIIILAELVLLVIASACGSARGATTDTASTCSCPSRQQVKCYTETMRRSEDAISVTAECENTEDVPLTGHCSRPGIGPEVLDTDGPSGWDIPAAQAAWTCGWSAPNSGGGYDFVNLPGATATICCLVNTQ